MTTIQIITISSEKRTIESIIEKINNNDFKLSTLENNNPCGNQKLSFESAADALTHVTQYFKNSTILEIENQISDLLTKEEISIITDFTPINES